MKVINKDGTARLRSCWRVSFFYILGNCFAYEKSVSEWKNVKKFVIYLTSVHLFDIFLLTVNEKGGVIAFICIKVISFISKIKEC